MHRFPKGKDLSCGLRMRNCQEAKVLVVQGSRAHRTPQEPTRLQRGSPLYVALVTVERESQVETE
jgi:hypothetical protein